MNTPLFASLPMYELAPLAGAWDELWAAIRRALSAQGLEAAELLDRGEPYQERWHDPNLILGQTCGWPFVRELRDAVLPIARFDFGLPTRRPGDYFSAFVRRRGDALATGRRPQGLAPLFDDPAFRIAVNHFESQSGCRVFGECFDAERKLSRDRIMLTGSHLASIRAVAAGDADLAAIDAVTWQFAREHEPAVRELHMVARSADAPGLPLIVARNLASRGEAVFRAVSTAVRDLAPETRSALHIRGVVPANGDDYGVLLRPPFGRLAIA